MGVTEGHAGTKKCPPVVRLDLFSCVAAELFSDTVSLVHSNAKASTRVDRQSINVEEKASELKHQRQLCTVCNVDLLELSGGVLEFHQLRSHYKSEWHKFNVRQAIKGKPPCNFEDFKAAAEHQKDAADKDDQNLSSISDNNDSEDSFSCSSVSSSESESESSEEAQEEECNHFQVRSIGNFVAFTTTSGKVFSIAKCLLPISQKHSADNEQEQVLVNFVRNGLKNQSTFAVIMLSGGRFAAAIFRGSQVLHHKTFHRYVVRAKQGGAQSLADAASGGSHPKSAGANLRRYNEKKMIEDIRNILNSWQDSFLECNYIFLRCSKKKQDIFLEAGGQSPPCLLKADPRLRSIPFTTYTPTFDEVRRIHKRLCSVLVYTDRTSFDTFAAQESNEPVQKYFKPKPPQVAASSGPLKSTSQSSKPNAKKAKPKPKAEKLIAEQPKEQFTAMTVVVTETESSHKLLQDASTKLYTAFRSNDLSVFLKCLKDQCTDDDNGEVTEEKLLNCGFGPDHQTLLHIAASNDNAEAVKFLLDLGADPCLKNKGKLLLVPYQCAASRAVRQAFIQFRSNNETRYDWKRAQVPEPLSVEEEAARAAKLQEKRRQERVVKREKEKTKKELEKIARAENEERQRFLALSDREKRALAAEKRLLKEHDLKGEPPQLGKRCFECATDISGKIPFEYGQNLFCSPKCLKAHRQKTTMEK